MRTRKNLTLFELGDLAQQKLLPKKSEGYLSDKLRIADAIEEMYTTAIDALNSLENTTNPHGDNSKDSQNAKGFLKLRKENQELETENQTRIIINELSAKIEYLPKESKNILSSLFSKVKRDTLYEFDALSTRHDYNSDSDYYSSSDYGSDCYSSSGSDSEHDSDSDSISTDQTQNPNYYEMPVLFRNKNGEHIPIHAVTPLIVSDLKDTKEYLTSLLRGPDHKATPATRTPATRL